MKVAVIGLGSMGKRRIRLLLERSDIEIIGIDSNIERCAEVSGRFHIKTYHSLKEALIDIEIQGAVISTSPLSHSTIIKDCLNSNLHVFTEINLVQDGYDENIRLAEKKGLVLFLSSTFLYRQETQRIIKEVRNTKGSVNYIYHVGQYLPDWHPWESYSSYFIGDPRTNGCREIMAIELPWIVSAFGNIKRVKVLRGKISGLNIDYNDSYQILLEHDTGVRGTFNVDVVSRKATRHLEIYGENLYMTWNGTPDSLYMYDTEKKEDIKIEFENASEHISGYAAFVTENPYREELSVFLSQIKDRAFVAKWDFSRDLKVLNIIDMIESK